MNDNNDNNDSRDNNATSETAIQAVMTAPVDTTPRAGFQDELARDLAMEWETTGRSTVAPTDDRRPPPREWWSTLGAAAVALLLVGGLVIVGSRRDIAPVATVPSTPTVPTPSTGPATTIVRPGLPDPTVPPSAPPSTPAPTAPPSSPPTTPVPPAVERPVGMVDWPPATAAQAPLDQLPHPLLGSDSGYSRAVRTETSEVWDTNDAAAVWVATDGPGWLMIISTPDPTSIVSMDWSESIDDAALTAQGWTTQRAWTDLGDSHSAIDVADAYGVVSLHGFGMTQDQLLQVARGMVRRPLPQAGWDLTDLPFPMQPFVEANERSTASRSVVYFDADLLPAAELSVSAIDSSVVQRGWWDEFTNRQTVELQPTMAGGTVSAQMLTTPDGTRIELIWVQNNALVSFTTVGLTTDEAIAAANSIVEVPAQQWRDSTVQPDPNDDGCQNLHC